MLEIFSLDLKMTHLRDGRFSDIGASEPLRFLLKKSRNMMKYIF